MQTRNPVIVMELPEKLNQSQVEPFLNELEPLLETDRPSIVLDCAPIRSIDSAGVEMLLHCLQEAIKRDGDLKLAAVSSGSAVILELMRVDRVFELFDTVEEAVSSFQVFAPAASAQTQPWYSPATGLADLKAAS